MKRWLGVSSTLFDIKIWNEGNAVIMLDDLRSITYATTTSTDTLPSGNCLLKCCIIGDTKRVFQIVGGSGFDSSYCIF